jgi:hypothetical protein
MPHHPSWHLGHLAARMRTPTSKKFQHFEARGQADDSKSPLAERIVEGERPSIHDWRRLRQSLPIQNDPVFMETFSGVQLHVRGTVC